MWGDGVLIYFGYPHGHEDDAEQVVRAGLVTFPSPDLACRTAATQTARRSTNLSALADIGGIEHRDGGAQRAD
jgi:hypothetical protein